MSERERETQHDVAAAAAQVPIAIFFFLAAFSSCRCCCLFPPGLIFWSLAVIFLRNFFLLAKTLLAFGCLRFGFPSPLYFGAILALLFFLSAKVLSSFLF